MAKGDFHNPFNPSVNAPDLHLDADDANKLLGFVKAYFGMEDSAILDPRNMNQHDYTLVEKYLYPHVDWWSQQPPFKDVVDSERAAAAARTAIREATERQDARNRIEDTRNGLLEAQENHPVVSEVKSDIPNYVDSDTSPFSSAREDVEQESSIWDKGAEFLGDIGEAWLVSGILRGSPAANRIYQVVRAVNTINRIRGID